MKNGVPKAQFWHSVLLWREILMRGAIFDLDGTLLDSMSIWQEQIECFVRSKGVTPPENLINMTKTLGTAQAIIKIIEWFHLEDDPQEALAQFEKIMFRYYQRSLPLKPHALDYLQTLQSAHIPMVIATATAQPLRRYWVLWKM